MLLKLRTAQYMLALQAWHAQNKDVLLWCNGLVPAVAMGGRKNRIVHLHQYATASTPFGTVRSS